MLLIVVITVGVVVTLVLLLMRQRKARARRLALAPEERWTRLLTEGHAPLRMAQIMMRRIPSPPRCKLCFNPFGGIPGRIMRLAGFRPSRKNPNFWRSGRLSGSLEWQGGVDAAAAEVDEGDQWCGSVEAEAAV